MNRAPLMGALLLGTLVAGTTAYADTTISSCQEITQSGRYILGSDLTPTTSGFSGCLTIHDTQNVELDCNGHHINGVGSKGVLFAQNVSGLTIDACQPHTAFSLPSVWIQDSQNVVIRHSNVFGQIEMDNVDGGQIFDNRMSEGTVLYQQNGSSNVVVSDNLLTSPTEISGNSAIVLTLGSHNVVRNNTIHGGWDRVTYLTDTNHPPLGDDDGIVLASESNDLVTNNFIDDVWDAAIEGVNTVTASTFTANYGDYVGVAFISSYHDTDWASNIVSFNAAKHVHLDNLFYFDLVDLAPFRTHGRLDNTFFFGNSLYPTNTVNPNGAIITDSATALPFEMINNYFTSNNFGPTAIPLIRPSTSAVDGGNNVCANISSSALHCVQDPGLSIVGVESLQKELDLPFSYQIAATGNPTSYQALGLPPGVSLNTTTGLISGQPTTSGIFNVMLTVSSPGGTQNAPLVLTIPQRSSVSGFKTDSMTQGNWKGTYGSDGFDIPAISSFIPSYAQLNITGQASKTLNVSFPDSTILQDANSAGRTATYWYSASTFTIDIALTDTKPHRVGIYFADVDGNNARTQTVRVYDAATQGPLDDVRTVTNFGNGQWLLWTVTGHVQIKVTNTNPSSNALVSGLFFGDAGGMAVQNGPPDPFTQGSWNRIYGQDGFLIATEAENFSGYSTVQPIGASTVTWAASTTHPAALEKGVGQTDRVASAWHSSPQFSFAIKIIDGETHPVSLYMTDFDSPGLRTQEISVFDAVTGATLSGPQAVTHFHEGVWLSWNISGHVRIQVTNTNPAANAVVSGVFFGKPRFATTPTPVLAPGGGTFTGLVQVQINELSANATIYYTLDDSSPTIDSPFKTHPGWGVGLTSSATLKAMAVAPGLLPSDIVSGTFVITVPTTTVPWPMLSLDSLSGQWSIHDAIAFRYDPGTAHTAVQYFWNFTPTNQGGGQYLAVSPRTTLPQINLSSLGLTPGQYTLTVTAMDATGQSNVASRTITLIDDVSAGTHVRVHPNPWRTDRGHGGSPILFDEMPLGSTVKIFTLSGHWIKTLNGSAGTASWDLEDDTGTRVASGSYLYWVTDRAGHKYRGLLSVIH